MAFTNWDMPQHWFRAIGVVVVLLLGMYALSPSRAEAPHLQPLAVELVPLADAQGRLSELGSDAKSLLLGVSGDTRQAHAELRFVLPPRDSESPHWVIWMRRAPVETVELRVNDTWKSGSRSFLAPQRFEGPMPVGYLFRLPSTWEGEIRLQLDATAMRLAALRPEVISEEQANRYVQEATIFASLSYASLLILSLMTLALFFASRDSGFLSFFVFCLCGVLLLAVFNGHVYLFEPFGIFRFLGGSGLHAVSLLFEVVSLRILLRYTDIEQTRPTLVKAINNGCVILLLAIGLLLAWREHLDAFAGIFMPLFWCLGCVVAFYVLGEAWRRRVPLAGAVFFSVLAIALSILAWELASRGMIAATLWTTYGYQAGIVLCASMIAVGLISRISKYREQRDREQRARADSERRMYREAVRSELMTMLQTSLRGVAEDEVQPIVFRHLLEHLRRIVPTTTAVAVARGYHGRDTLVVQPAAYLDDVEANVGQRLQTLRKQLAGNIELQRPVTKTGELTPVAIEALIALPVRAPAWGLIVLERSGATVFHPEELTIVRELARLALLQADEAIAALHLRHTAEIDALTGALNRRSLDQSLARTFQHAHRKGLPLSVLFVDIDRFKAINDKLGHASGDHCLREIAKTIAAQLSEDDIFGRYGGEEFLVILPGRQTEMARAIAEQIRLAVEHTDVRYQEQPLRLTVSIGVATQLSHEGQPQPAVERADKALYAAKRAGRNRVNVAPAVFASRPATA
ncbi:MAG: diguanylate cyclase [Xanthomonadales bacterium]|nr:diguanylate cyclase [Xanthomonadales bacterium]